MINPNFELLLFSSLLLLFIEQLSQFCLKTVLPFCSVVWCPMSFSLKSLANVSAEPMRWGGEPEHITGSGTQQSGREPRP